MRTSDTLFCFAHRGYPKRATENTLQAITHALEQTGHNKTAAAKLLGITFRAMRYRLKKLGLNNCSK